MISTVFSVPFRPNIWATPLRSIHSKASSISYIPHCFSPEEGARRFLHNSRNRFSALSQGSPLLRPAYLSFLVAKIAVTGGKYSGSYGVLRPHQHTDFSMEWFPVTGAVKNKIYDRDNHWMRVYAGGLDWNQKIIESLFYNTVINNKLRVFKPQAMETGVCLDAFQKESSRAIESIDGRIRGLENARAARDVRGHVYCDDVEISCLEIDYEVLKVDSIYLPVYVVEGWPAKMISAADKQGHIVSFHPTVFINAKALDGTNFIR